VSKVSGKMPLLKLQMIFTGLKSGTRSLSGNIPPLNGIRAALPKGKLWGLLW